MEKTFNVLIQPLLEYIEKNGESIDKASGSRTFKFQHFTLTMVFAYLMQIPSLRKLENKLELSDTAKKIKLNLHGQRFEMVSLDLVLIFSWPCIVVYYNKRLLFA